MFELSWISKAQNASLDAQTTENVLFFSCDQNWLSSFGTRLGILEG